jgi:osmotically-inducible protein OsmY
VNGGVVTLTGYARNYFEKHRAEAAAKRVRGVAAVADDVDVRTNLKETDHDFHEFSPSTAA